MGNCSDSEELHERERCQRRSNSTGGSLCGFFTAEQISCRKNYYFVVWPRKNPIKSTQFWDLIFDANPVISWLIPVWVCSELTTYKASMYLFWVLALCTYPLSESWKVLANGSVFRTLNSQSAELGMGALSFFFPETSTETPEFQCLSVQAAHLQPYLGAMAVAIPLNPVKNQELLCWSG